MAVGTEFTVTVFLALIQDPVGASSGIAWGAVRNIRVFGAALGKGWLQEAVAASSRIHLIWQLRARSASRSWPKVLAPS